MSHLSEDTIAVATQAQAAPAPAYFNSTVIIETQDDLVRFAAHFLSKDGRHAQQVDTLVLRVPFLITRNHQLLLQLIRRLPQLARLWMLHSEMLLGRHPVLADHIVDRTSLTELKLDHVGAIAYRLVARLRSRLVSIHMHAPAGTSVRWNYTGALLQSSAATLQEIDMPNVVLDLRARNVQFPLVRIVLLTYDCPAVFDLRAYKFAFPNLRDFRLSLTPAIPRLLAEQEMHRRRNLLAGMDERGWENLNRIYAPPYDLWLLGLLMPVDILSLPIGPGGAAHQRLFDVLSALNPKHLELQFQNTEDARAVVRDFGTLLNPLRVPRLHTLVLDCYLPLVQLCLSQLLVRAASSFRNLTLT